MPLSSGNWICNGKFYVADGWSKCTGSSKNPYSRSSVIVNFWSRLTFKLVVWVKQTDYSN